MGKGLGGGKEGGRGGWVRGGADWKEGPEGGRGRGPPNPEAAAGLPEAGTAATAALAGVEPALRLHFVEGSKPGGLS